MMGPTATELIRRRAGTEFLATVRVVAKGNGDLITRAAVDPITGPYSGLSGYAEWISGVTARAVLTQIGTQVPFSTAVPVLTTRPTGFWLGGFAPKPVVRMSLASATLDPRKVANLCPVSDELIANSSPAADAALSRILEDSVVGAMNATLLSDEAAVLNVSPAGLAFGLAPIAGAGLGEDDLFEALVALLYGLDRPVLVASLAIALRVRAALGAAGALVAIVVAPEAGDRIFAVDADALAVAFGGVEVTESNAAAIQMADNPSAGAASLVSAWQTNSTILRAVVVCNWEVVDADGVRVLDLGLES